MRKRFTILTWLCFFLFGGILVRLFYWQVLKGPELRALAQSQYERTSSVQAKRGVVYTADGYPLVMNSDIYTLFATPRTLSTTPQGIAAALVPILYEESELVATQPAFLERERQLFQESLIARLSSGDKQWVSVKTGVTDVQKKRIEEFRFSGLGFDTLSRRYYPEASMAAHIVGFVGKDERGDDKGYFGIEGQYDLELKGTAAVYTQETDALGHPIVLTDVEQSGSIESRDLVLTIRRDLQHLLEAELVRGVQRYGAKAADAVIMEPKTGRILAMASYPQYDPSRFSKADPRLYKNPLIADGYEPGSTFKVITVASGIDTGVIAPETQCDSCNGPVTIGKYAIRTWNEEYHPGITMTEALAKSDNTAMVFVGRRLGKERFVSYLKAFGIGQETGIDLQEEASPNLRDENKWAEIDLATATFGQGVAVTGIQMINAVAAVANDGILMQPQIVQNVTTGNTSYAIQPRQIRRVISSNTAKTVQNMMIEAASHGDAKWTLPKAYSIAGKTGTAQIPVDGHYDAERTIASFVGFAPAHDAKFAMLVRVTEPTTSPWGSETAAPLWFSIAEELFVKFGIEKNTVN